MLKKIEKLLSNRIRSTLDRGLKPQLVDCYSPEIASCKKILLLRQDRIGDVLVSTPFIQSLRNALPDAQIDILLSKKNYGIRRAVEPFVNKIWVYNKEISKTIELLLALRKEKYELIIDMLDKPSTTSSTLLKLVNPKLAIGFDKSNNSTYNAIVPLPEITEKHIVLRLNNLLLPFGVIPDSSSQRIFYPIEGKDKQNAELKLGEKHGTKRLGINLFGSSQRRFWGIDNNIAFIERMYKEFADIEIIVFATAERREIQEKICTNTKAKPAPIVASVHEFAAMLSCCDCIMSPDTSAIHLSAAFGIPCIILNSQLTIQHGIPWTPFNSPYKVLVSPQDDLHAISIDEAIEAYRHLIYDEKK